MHNVKFIIKLYDCREILSRFGQNELFIIEISMNLLALLAPFWFLCFAKPIFIIFIFIYLPMLQSNGYFFPPPLKLIFPQNLCSLSNIQYRYKMFEENVLRSSEQQLDFLLDYSRISDGHKETSFQEFSISRDKLNISEKQRTREESYEDIMKQIHQTKLERLDLAAQLQACKQEIYSLYLHNFTEELRELNQENQRIRKEMNKSQMKNRDDRSQRLSNRSSIKMKTSVKSQYGNENMKTNTKNQRNRVSPNVLFAKKEIKLTQSTANLGRSQIQSPIRHKKRESQLTERKIDENHSMGVSVNISILDDRADQFNIKQSVSNKCLNNQRQKDKNVFVQILQDILIEEKQYQTRKYGQLQECTNTISQSHLRNEVTFINQMEGEIKDTNEKIEMLGMILNKFQKELKELNVNIKNADEWTTKLWEIKGRYINMQRKCNELSNLRKEVSSKQQKLSKMRAKVINTQQEKSITSIETMIKVLSNPSKSFNPSTKLYMTYYRQIKELFKFGSQQQTKRYNKAIKVKQTIDNIREGRKKFNELIGIYQSRVLKLQEKISKVKQNNQRR